MAERMMMAMRRKDMIKMAAEKSSMDAPPPRSMIETLRRVVIHVDKTAAQPRPRHFSYGFSPQIRSTRVRVFDPTGRGDLDWPASRRPMWRTFGVSEVASVSTRERAVTRANSTTSPETLASSKRGRVICAPMWMRGGWRKRRRQSR
jgi:hypothetical protein